MDTITTLKDVYLFIDKHLIRLSFASLFRIFMELYMFDLLNQIISGVVVFLICTWLQKRFTILKTETSIKRVVVIRTIRNEYVEQEKPLSLSEKIYLSNSFFIILTYFMLYIFIYLTLCILTIFFDQKGSCFLLSQAHYLGFMLPNIPICNMPILQTSLFFITAIGYLIIFMLSKFISDPVLKYVTSRYNPDPFLIRKTQFLIFITMMLFFSALLHWLYSTDSLYTSLAFVVGSFIIALGLGSSSHEKA